MKQVPIYSMDGKEIERISLPEIFSTKINLYLIARAAIADQTQLYQPKGNYIYAGLETSAKYRGRKEDYGSLKNRGQARLPREVLPDGGWGKVRRIPSSVKGRRAHPPKVEKKIVEKINKKEYAKALASALAACTNIDFVLKRGHKINKELVLPIILDSEDSPAKTSQALKLFEKLGLKDDILRAKQKTKKVSGIRLRKGGKKTPKSFLVVVENLDSNLAKASRNLPGVDVVDVKALKVLDLAPGTHPARLLVISKKALGALVQKFSDLKNFAKG
ncbi:MAG: 50S ribosomal protein L4 [Candidatus Micrarchaeota archaeon]|nr:50S ribosomal protein L4 [Candidatus Micrarchaeota archaeon]